MKINPMPLAKLCVTEMPKSNEEKNTIALSIQSFGNQGGENQKQNGIKKIKIGKRI